MDIHAPHEPVHTWKDFATHLAIVTIGLFIALMLEAGVEHLHHRHIVREARENIRVELQANHLAAQQDIAYVTEDMKTIAANIVTVHKLQQRDNSAHSLVNHMQFNGFDVAAWNTARNTGALAYMPYSEVQRDSSIYADTQDANDSARDDAKHEFLALAPTLMGYDMSKLPPEEYTTLLRENASSLIELCTLRQYIQQVDNEYIDALSLATPKNTQLDCSDVIK